MIKIIHPLPNDDVEIFLLVGYYGVIRFSGRSKDKNFSRHSKILKKELEENNIQIIGPSIKATYNGPFTLAPLEEMKVCILLTGINKIKTVLYE